MVSVSKSSMARKSFRSQLPFTSEVVGEVTEEAWQETRRRREEKVAGEESDTAEKRVRVVDDEEERERAGDRGVET